MSNLVPLLKKLLQGLLAYTYISLIIAVKPFVVIRIQPLNAWRIGHFLVNTEITLGRLDLGELPTPPRAFDFWHIDSRVSNAQILKMRQRHLNVWRLPAGHTLRRALASQHFLRNHLIDLETTGLDFFDVLARTAPTLQLSPSEFQEASGQAQNLGLPQSARWVCIAARDSAYLDKALPGRDWAYHNYRDSSIANYVLAAESLANLGYFVIRMGREVAKEIPSRHPRVIDYATSEFKSDLLDVYLGFNCQFFLSTGSGVEDFAGVARRPRCYVNVVPFGGLRLEEPLSIHITKLHLDSRTGTQLTQSQLIDRDAPLFYSSQLFKDADIELYENTPEEIRDVAMEMLALVESRPKYSKIDHINQEKFWSIFPSKGLRAEGVPIRTRFGRDFLRSNPQWLE